MASLSFKTLDRGESSIHSASTMAASQSSPLHGFV